MIYLLLFYFLVNSCFIELVVTSEKEVVLSTWNYFLFLAYAVSISPFGGREKEVLDRISAAISSETLTSGAPGRPRHIKY